jgi:hypothetical protein
VPFLDATTNLSGECLKLGCNLPVSVLLNPYYS